MGCGASRDDDIVPLGGNNNHNRRSIAQNNSSQAGSVITSTYLASTSVKQPLHATVQDVNHNHPVAFATSIKGSSSSSNHPNSHPNNKLLSASLSSSFASSSLASPTSSPSKAGGGVGGASSLLNALPNGRARSPMKHTTSSFPVPLNAGGGVNGGGSTSSPLSGLHSVAALGTVIAHAQGMMGGGTVSMPPRQPDRLLFHPTSHLESVERLMYLFGTTENGCLGIPAAASSSLASRMLRQMEDHGEPPSSNTWREMNGGGGGGASAANSPSAKQAPASSSSSAQQALFATRVPLAAPTNFAFSSVGGQSGAIRSLSCSVDGSQVCVVVVGKTMIHVADAICGNLLLAIRGNGEELLSCAMSRDGKFVLGTTAAGTATMWDLNNGKRIRDVRLPGDTIATLCALSDDGEYIATTSLHEPGAVTIWDGKGADALVQGVRHRGGTAVTAMAFTRRETKWIATGAENGEVRVWSPFPPKLNRPGSSSSSTDGSGSAPPPSEKKSTRHHHHQPQPFHTTNGSLDVPGSSSGLDPNSSNHANNVSSSSSPQYVPQSDLFYRSGSECHKSAIRAISISNDGRRLLTVDEMFLCVWDLFVGSIVFVRHASENGAVRFGANDETARLFSSAPSSSSTSSPSSSNSRYTTATFTAGGFILFATREKSVIAINGNDGTELFTCYVKAPVTVMGTSWHADTILLGDSVGNQYRLVLSFSGKDTQLFGLDRKPAVKDKGKID